jgi:DNA-binding beta-propeller fold protein YncE
MNGNAFNVYCDESARLEHDGQPYLMNFLLIALICAFFSGCESGTWLSPGDAVVDGSRNIAFVALTGSRSVAAIDLNTNRVVGRIELENNPSKLLLSRCGTTLFVAGGGANGTLSAVDAAERKVKFTVGVGHSPCGMALSPDEKTLYVANRFDSEISVVDLARRETVATLPAPREVQAICITPDGKTLAAAGFLPEQASVDSTVAAQVALFDLSSNTLRCRLTLENGAQSAAGIACSADGRRLYVCHLLSRYDIPITQLDRGWVNSNALGVIDLEGDSLLATLLLDDVDRGAANPADIRAAGGNLYVALAGTHELMILDEKAMLDKLEAFFSGKLDDAYLRNAADLSSSLSFASSFKRRIGLLVVSPRASALCPDGSVLVTGRFSTFAERIHKGGVSSLATLGSEPAPDAARRGELAFCDASICYQGWQSCVSCHPDGRVDALNWDQQNDGLGNPKNTKSLLFSHQTPPSMITGIRQSAELAVRKGILHTLGTLQPESLAADIDEYLKRLRPEASPFEREYREKYPDDKGRKAFEKAECLMCHNGEYFTDKKKYNVGTGIDSDSAAAFDTPTLRELWRTAPYLYDGRAASLHEVFSRFNPLDKHGKTSSLDQEETEALILYLLKL